MASESTSTTSVSVLSGESLPNVRASVIVPTYERLPALQALLESLAGQRLLKGTFEVVLSDDGSRADIEAIARQFAGRFQRLVLVRGRNAGPGIARNRGSSHARGATLAFIDSDCIAPQPWLESLTQAVEAGAPIVHGPVTSSVSPIEPFVHSFQIYDRPFPGANFAVSRDLFTSLGGFRSDISRIAEDHDIAERFRSAGHTPLFLPAASIEHPPQPKRVSLSLIPTAQASEKYRDLASFYRANPGRVNECLATNRRLFAKAVTKLAVVLAPVALLSGPGWLVGPTIFCIVSLRKWRRANRLLSQGGAGFRVPLTEGLKYAMFMPLQDAVLLAHRVRFGLLRPGNH